MPIDRTFRTQEAEAWARAKLLPLALLGILSATAACAQTLPMTKLPATTPTAPAVAQPAAATPPLPQGRGPAPAQRAQIQFSNGALTVTAENSSLNQILRDIGQLTGMTITGGVTDERVFGVYGPATTETILTALLDGTGSNIVIVEGRGQSPRELVLTPRQGGPSPPNPNSYHDPAPLQNLPPQQNQNLVNRDDPPAPPQPQPPAQPTQAPAPDIPAVSAPPAATPGDMTTQQSPNGVKTPQQIYEELMKMQQQQTAKPPQ